MPSAVMAATSPDAKVVCTAGPTSGMDDGRHRGGGGGGAFQDQ